MDGNRILIIEESWTLMLNVVNCFKLLSVDWPSVFGSFWVVFTSVENVVGCSR